MSSRYNAADIEVLSGLEPVKRRPGMYTDTSRPNHLAQEVIDNAVDEALAGHARTVEVTLYSDGSCEVADDGRGMAPEMRKKPRSFGLQGLQERARRAGGWMDISSRPGHGTSVIMTVPLTSPAGKAGDVQ